MGLLLIIITAYLFGKKVEEKGYGSYRYRIRHVCACIFTSMMASLISYSLKESIEIAGSTGFVAMIGIIIYRYQVLSELEPKKT
ncbi:MAG: hypothetical protein BGO31_18910 [Bacteroidetes bacterium 43-16]|nr:MAG: hypothetical protein BGO31_18910 [Bacteroidetes bacterium 43-16]